jgi:Domain of unknown function (DUF1707)
VNEPAFGRGRPPGHAVWVWTPTSSPTSDLAPPTAPLHTGPLRIGDAERDRAVAALGDHFAAGRLTREELDERIDEAMRARFDADLAPVLADLPAIRGADRTPGSVPGWPAGVRPVPPPFLWLVPLLLVALVVGAIALSAPWLLWGLVWMMVFSRFWGRRHYHGGSWQHR